jgi:chromosome segregation ATPase
LLQDGIAKRIDTYFVRPLNDYRFALRRLQNRIAEMEYQRNELQYQIQVIQDAVDDTEAMLVQNQQDKLKLEKDVAQVGTELKAIQTYRQNLAETLADTRQQLVSLYRSNLQLTQQLSQAHQTLQTEIDARSEADSL